MAGTKSEIAKNLEHPRRDVAATRIQNRIVIRKRDILEKRVLHVFVERSPTAVSVLKAQQPSNHPVVQRGIILVACGM